MDQTCLFLADQIRRSFEGDAWHGPSLRELLADISPMQAAAHPISSGHSIWEIVLHITVWTEIAFHAMQGTSMPHQLPEERDWAKPFDIGPQAWNKTIRLSLETEAKLCRAIETFPVERLLAIVPGRE